MRYYKHLYLTEGLEKKKEKIIRKLESGKLQPSVHVITLAISEKNQLEIYPTLQFKQPAIRTCIWCHRSWQMMQKVFWIQ